MRSLLLGIVLLSSFIGSAQDSSYVVGEREKLTLKVYTVEKFSRIFISDLGQDLQYRYHPNEVANIGLGLNYKWIGIALAFNPAPNRRVEKFGRTNKLDLQINSYGRKFGFDLSLQFYGGYYLENPDEIDSTWTRPNFPKREDLITFNFGLNSYYVLNHEHFSYRATFNQTEIQEKSAGSFVAGLYGSIYSVNSSTPLMGYVNGELRDPNAPFVGGGAFLTGGGSFGYIHTFVAKKYFYFTIGAIPALGLQISYVDRDFQPDLTKLRFAGKIQFLGGFGYNRERFFTGFSGLSNNQRLFNSDGIRISNEIGALRFFVGTRF